jgi:hypothetical protein
MVGRRRHSLGPRGGPDSENVTNINDPATGKRGAPRVQDHAQYRTSATSGVNTILGLV